MPDAPKKRSMTAKADSTESDSQLPRDGEPVDWALWLDAYGSRLLLYARQQCRTESDAEDVMQEALMQLVRVVESGEFKGVAEQWPSYVYTAIRHLAMDRGRKEEVRRGYEEKVKASMEESSDDAPWLTSAADDEYLRGRIEALLRNIPQEFAEVIILKIWGEQTFQQIADATGTPLSTITSRYRYGLQAMRRELEENPIDD